MSSISSVSSLASTYQPSTASQNTPATHKGHHHHHHGAKPAAASPATTPSAESTGSGAASATGSNTAGSGLDAKA